VQATQLGVLDPQLMHVIDGATLVPQEFLGAIHQRARRHTISRQILTAGAVAPFSEQRDKPLLSRLQLTPNINW
jgi:hypothetical protein